MPVMVFDTSLLSFVTMLECFSVGTLGLVALMLFTLTGYSFMKLLI